VPSPAGCAESAPIACSEDSIADLFAEHDQALMMAVYTVLCSVVSECHISVIPLSDDAEKQVW